MENFEKKIQSTIKVVLSFTIISALVACGAQKTVVETQNETTKSNETKTQLKKYDSDVVTPIPERTYFHR